MQRKRKFERLSIRKEKKGYSVGLGNRVRHNVDTRREAEYWLKRMKARK